MGTPPQKMRVMFDTGSALMYMATDKCKNCPNDMSLFETSKSSTYTGSGNRQAQSYGSGSVEGEIAQETVCFSKDQLSCVSSASFIAVDQASEVGKDRFSGIIGLSPF
jgi:hypothetical protein